MVEICDVRHEYPYGLSPVLMEYFVNNDLDKTHRDISEHDIETNRIAVKMVIAEFPDGNDDEKIKKKQRKKLWCNTQS